MTSIHPVALVRVLGLRRPRTSHLVQIAIVGSLIVYASSSSYLTFLGTTAVISALLLLSVGIVIGDVGMPSLCQISFAGIGAWIMTRFAAASHPLPVLLEIVITCLLTGVVGVVVSLPAMRLRAVNLAVVTLGIASAVVVFLSATGFPVPESGLSIELPASFNSDQDLFLGSVAVFFLVVIALTWVRSGPLGSAWLSVRHSERATSSLGVSVVWAKASAFGISAMIAALSGVMLLTLIGIANSNNFPVAQSLVIFAVGRFIGSWRWQGALMAGILNVAVPELLSHFGLSPDYFNVLFAVGAIQALASGGSVADSLWPRRRHSAPPGELRSDGWGSGSAGSGTRAARHEGGTAVLAVDGLSVSFGGVQALDGVSLQVPAGAVTGLLGANGAGKTTFIDAVTGFTRSTGSITVAGRVVGGSPQRRALAGVRRTFQQDKLPGALSVGDYFRLSARGRPTEAEVEQLLGFVQLPSAEILIDSLDTARRRLVEVAAAFAAKPDVVLLDEPVAGLSSAEALVFARNLRQAPAVFGSAVLLIEHDLDFVRAVCAEVVVLDFGKVIACGAPEEILKEPVVRAAYLGEVDQVDATGL